MLVHGVLIFAASIAGIVRAGNTTCKTTSLDWYTQSVGETPCRTYERLRQLCSADYQVGDFRSATPGDNCGGQPATCCCNSVSWALSMLCMNCQYGVGSSVNGDTGFDAGVGAYGGYLNNCGRPTNKTLPDTIQTAVCKQNIKIPAFTYNLFWVDGAWFYEYSKGTAQLDISSGKNDTGLCPTPSPSSTSSTATSTVTATPQPTSSQSSTPVGAIAGGVVGGVVLLAAAVLLGFFISRRRKNRGGVIDLTDESKPPSATFESYNLPPGAIAQPVAITPYAAPSSSEGTSTTGSPPPTQASSSRHNKPGMIAPSPPNRAEMYQSHPLLSTQGGSSSHISSDDRHEDSEDLSSAYGLGRSASGRLPPAYRG